MVSKQTVFLKVNKQQKMQTKKTYSGTMYVDRIADGKYWNVDGNQRAAYGYTGWSIQTAKDNLMDQVYEFSRVLFFYILEL